MKILVLLRMAPDVVEELEIAPDGKALDTEFLRTIPNESDDHAIEQALLLKERHGGEAIVLALDAPEVDDALYASLAKGADRAMKIVGLEEGCSTRQAASLFSAVIGSDPALAAADLILTGVQAIDDLDGLVAPAVAYELGRPYVGIVTHVAADPAARTVTVLKEYPGGVHGEFEMPLPCVLGIQSAEKPPRYVPVAKVRAVMKTRKIEAAQAPTMADAGQPLVEITCMSKHEPAGRAEMLEGPPDAVAGKLVDLFRGRGLL
jgi:electron transfer flavoprotein beta subunit